MAVPFMPPERLRQVAADFQQQYNLPKHLPVPIDTIAEFGFGIDVIPLPGLERTYGIVGFISKDLTEIRIDELVYKNQEARYRFTIAHELSHAVLHAELFEQADFGTVEQWKQFIESGINDADYYRLEYQANFLAGLLLVPEPQLKSEFGKAVKLAEQNGLDVFDEIETSTEYIASHLRKESIFNVGLTTMKIRIEQDKLFELY